MPNNAEQALQQTRFFPYWLDNPDRPAAEPALTSDLDTDLLIVGSGFTGLWTAIQAKEQNSQRQVVVIEANTAAIGASGRPGAILSTSLMHGMENSNRLFASEMEELERLGKENMDQFRETIEKYNIDCDIEWSGELTVAVGKHGIQDIETEHELYVKFGHDAHLLSQQQVKAEINSPLFAGGLWSKQRSGTVHPAKLAWGLKRVAQQLGVTFYEHTPMQHSKLKAGKVVVQTPKANIRANKVILATNAFTKHKKKIASRVAAIRDRIVVTEPLSDAQLQALGWRNRQGIYDTRTQLNYMRLTADNRVLFGGRLGYFFNNNTDPQYDKTAEPYVRLVQALYRTLPVLQGIKISHAWSGPIALTTRMAVHYQHYHGGKMLFAGGYSGFGVTASRFAARVALAIVDDVDIPERQLEFAKTLPSWLPPEPFRWIGAKITMYALDTCDEKGGWRIPWLNMVEAMGFPLKP
ncbi:NAD(P)/FAD-dependent oxidoreductase [Thalassotalea mangrovi]|uniref:FAD-dependent oxidoreductase n=1 Tax=Thalassotalea mangrovi TaxID=2572245 RepID=A0A4U1B4U8_9GAMM|nr:FAD-dependent oxidoreductase [Thalassotalea mangrovi]TKB45374.1 FAD-dependent oxidoreductase [Thalassotalea mangrovi]